MPFGGFLNAIPPAVFLLIHIVLFVIGVVFARRSFGAGQGRLGWGFTLFAVAEVSYMTYHLDWTVFLFAHTLAEVLDALAFIAIFTAVSQKMLAARRA
ncbi:MAG: hypothetical protein QN155_07120 [Armatimonadota bacterium]|nr:hypothetical protein [Armatimonadota bacterium]MDR7403941.1 hypothetical protein [Armatimonadota bacterium]